MAHKFHDATIGEIEYSPCGKEILLINIDPAKEPDIANLSDFNAIFLAKEDIVELAKYMNLVVYEKDSVL